MPFTRITRVATHALILVACCFTAVQAQMSLTEDFTTNTYNWTTYTSADWDTVSGELKLFPFAADSVGSYDTAGNAFHIAIAGDVAYVVDNPDVAILDISDPANPALLGTFAAGDAQGLYCDGDLLYVAAGSFGLTIVDVSDPTTPTQVGNLDTPRFAVDVVVKGGLAYVANELTGLIIISVLNPAAPLQVGLYDTPNQAHGVDVSGNYCYVADRGGSGLVVLDVSDASTPTLAGGYVFPGDTWNVSIDGDLAYVSDAGTNGLGLAILDVSDPTSPALLGSVDPGTVRRTAVSGNFAIAAGYSQVHVIDCADPTNPTLVESWNSHGIASSVAIEGPLAYVADGADGGVQVVRVREVVTSPIELALAPLPGASDVRVAGDYAYVGTTSSGLNVYDISNPASPVLVGNFAPMHWVSAPALEGDYAFVGTDSLLILDISDPTNPAQIGSYVMGNGVSAIDVSGGIVYLGGNNMFESVYVADPTSPIPYGSATLAGVALDVEVVGNLAFVAANSLEILDVSTPLMPTVASYPLFALGLAVAGDYVYLALGNQGLAVLDISNPSFPQLVATLPTAASMWEISIQGDYAFVANAYGGVSVIDISDPTAPVEVGGLVEGEVLDIRIAGQYAFLADDLAGFRVWQVFQREFAVTGRYRGLSTIFDAGGGNNITRARLTTTQTDGVSWELVTNGPTAIPPDGAWYPVPPALGFVWRSTHEWFAPGQNPTVSDLTLDWLTDAGFPGTVADVPGDQGGWVRVAFTRSGYDFADEATYPVTGYQIYQRVDDAMAAQVRKSGVPITASSGTMGMPELAGVDASRLRALGDRRFVIGPVAAAGAFPPGTWEAVAWVAATQSDTYTARVSTTADSTGSGVDWSVYLVTTHTPTPSVWFSSEPDSGYSVDNLAPAVPANFAIAYNTGGGNTLSWDPSPEPDFQYYRVYRSTDPNFTPTPADLVHQTTTPDWTDTEIAGGTVHYRVTALDHAGNESDPAGSTMVTAIEDTSVPARLALHSNVPNPFNPMTTIHYDVPPAGAAVEIVVFDASGRRVRMLVDGHVSGGRRSVVWDGRNDRGLAVASGMYFYRMRSGSFNQTKKMLLLK